MPACQPATRHIAQVRQLLTAVERNQLEELCGRCLVDELLTAVAYHNGEKVFMATGDIPFMWIRDSAVQLGALVPRVVRQPALRLLVEGAVRTQVRVACQDAGVDAAARRGTTLTGSRHSLDCWGPAPRAGLHDRAGPVRQLVLPQLAQGVGPEQE